MDRLSKQKITLRNKVKNQVRSLEGKVGGGQDEQDGSNHAPSLKSFNNIEDFFISTKVATIYPTV